MNIDRKNFVEGLTWDQVAQRLGNEAMAIIPVGSGCKQHGFHMPMGADRIQAEWFSALISTKIDAVVWPTLTYGFYPAFVAYPGSISLSCATFEAVVGEIVDALTAYGARRILILDTGLSTGAPIANVLARLKRPESIKHLAIYSGPHFLEAASKLSRQSHGSHADEIETSIMLALAPQIVDMTRAQASEPLIDGPQAGPLNWDDPASANYSASGSFGDPSLASKDKGQVLIDAIVEDLLAEFNIG